MSSSHSAAILVSDQSHHGPPFLAPPSWFAVSGPVVTQAGHAPRRSVLSCSSSTCQRFPLASRALRLNPYAGQSSSGSTQAACDQYSNVALLAPQ